MPAWWVPFALLAAAAVGDAGTWRNYRRRMAPSSQDAGTLRVNNLLGWFAFISGLASGVALRGAAAFAIPQWLAWAGVPIALCGIALRVWAVAALGEWFSLTIQVRPDQPVIDRGPYRIVRHPGYLAGDVAFLGTGLSAGNWLSPLLFVVPWVVAHVHRIGVEEQVLVDILGERYRADQGRTWRMLPFVW